MKWVDRALIVAPMYIGLCIEEKKFNRALKELKIPRDAWPSFLITSSANATAHFFAKPNGEQCVIVTIAPSKDASIAQIHALLVHEAVHIWQEVRQHIGEKWPSSEFEAYSIQSISQRLMEAYADLTKAKKK